MGPVIAIKPLICTAEAPSSELCATEQADQFHFVTDNWIQLQIIDEYLAAWRTQDGSPAQAEL